MCTNSTMCTKLISLLLGVAESGATWDTWLPMLVLLVGAVTTMLCRERARRQTYREVLKAMPPGTYLSDQTQRRSRLEVSRLPESTPSRLHVVRQTIEGVVDD